MTTVTFVDTSVLCELLQVPGKSVGGKDRELAAEMDSRRSAGERFVIPITALIETGNHIAQCGGDRYQLAGRLVALIQAALDGEAPWLLLETRLDRAFLAGLCAGDSTGRSLQDLAASKVGAGDVALLVERDQFLAGSAFSTARVWTFDHGLGAAAEGSSG